MTLAITPNNVLMGPALLYWAPTGTAEPADSAVTPDGYLTVPPAPWTDVGGTETGVSVDIEDTITDLEVNQIPLGIGGRLTKRTIQVTTTLAEMTLQNLNLSVNGNLQIGNEVQYATADLLTANSATQLPYIALMMYGWAPVLLTGKPALRRVIVRKCLSMPKVNLDYEMAKPASVSVTFKAYYIAPLISPLHITDALV